MKKRVTVTHFTMKSMRTYWARLSWWILQCYDPFSLGAPF